MKNKNVFIEKLEVYKRNQIDSIESKIQILQAIEHDLHASIEQMKMYKGNVSNTMKAEGTDSIFMWTECCDNKYKSTIQQLGSQYQK